jgi:hypothetical protein
MALKKLEGSYMNLIMKHTPLNNLRELIGADQDLWMDGSWNVIKKGINEILYKRQENRATEASNRVLKVRSAFLSFIRSVWLSLPNTVHFYGREALYECKDGSNYFSILPEIAKRICEILFFGKTTLTFGNETIELPNEICESILLLQSHFILFS